MDSNLDRGIASASAGVVLGMLLALLGSLEPFAPNAFHLQGLVFAAGLVPYAVLGVFAGILRGTPLVLATAGVVAPHLLVLLLTPAGAPARAWVPLLLAALLGLLIPAAVKVLRQADAGQG